MSNLSQAIVVHLTCPVCKSRESLHCEVGYEYDEGSVEEDGTSSDPHALLTTELERIDCGCPRDLILDEFDVVNEQGKDSYDYP